MSLGLVDVLHPRILENCQELFREGHYKQAAHTAMTQVELALREKSPTKTKLVGVRLVSELFGGGQSAKLIVPLSTELQGFAEEFFEGSFKYYRNYAAHDGSRIDRYVCARVMVIASELLDLVSTSLESLQSYVQVGGVPGLVKRGRFTDGEQLRDLLSILDGYCITYNDPSGLYEQLWEKGMEESQIDVLMETGLVSYDDVGPGIPSEVDPDPPDAIGFFRLTDLGKRVLKVDESL